MINIAVDLQCWVMSLWKTFTEVCCSLHIILWEYLLSKVDFYLEVYIRHRKFWSFIFIMMHIYRNWRNLTKGKDFNFANGFETIQGALAVVDKIYFTDSPWFHVNEYVNSQNNQVWNVENPLFFHEQSLYSLKVRVHCGVSHLHVIGSLFFSKIVNARPYQQLSKWFIPL